MSRVAKKPIELPKDVEVKFEGQQVTVKGAKGLLNLNLHPTVSVKQEGNALQVASASESDEHRALAGTMRALLNNMVNGVSKGFERRLQLVGVGYKAQSQGKILNLALGFSHPINFPVPEGITAETPTPTEILLKGIDRELLGATAAKIRGFRPPEPYKGKGVRYFGERINMKETKKKK